MGNSASLLDENETLKKKSEHLQSTILDMERELKRLEREIYDLRAELKKYDKIMLFSRDARPENNEDIL
jgi:predicted  nucleic acid-binding Zn-ribbon protein